MKIKTPAKEKLQKDKNIKGTLSYITYFLILVFVCVGFAATVKFVFLLKKSTFSGSSYSVLVASEKPFIIVANKTYSKLTYAKLEKRNFKNSVEGGMYLGIPIDGEIKTSDKSLSPASFSDIGFLVRTITQPWQYSYSNMTLIDTLKLIFSSITTPKNQIETLSINVKNGDLEGISPEKIYDIFKDPNIINEQKSIEIINATPVDGLGGKVGKVLKNAGVNVISITSGKEERVSSIFSATDSKTLKRISQILNIAPVTTNVNQISDIKILIGLDFMDSVE